jgi:hypothetical protein
VIGVLIEHDPLDLLLRVVLVGLGGWRLASLLVHEEGPWEVFLRLRRLATRIAPADRRGFWELLLDCVFCASVWTVTGLWLLWLVTPVLAALPAAWTVAIIVERWVFPPQEG